MTLENPSTQTVPSSAGPQHLCIHTPSCPTAEAADHEAAVPVATHPEQGWSLLCNGVVLFEDTGELLPDGRIIGPRRLTDPFGAPLGSKAAGTATSVATP